MAPLNLQEYPHSPIRKYSIVNKNQIYFIMMSWYLVATINLKKIKTWRRMELLAKSSMAEVAGSRDWQCCNLCLIMSFFSLVHVYSPETLTCRTLVMSWVRLWTWRATRQTSDQTGREASCPPTGQCHHTIKSMKIDKSQQMGQRVL